MSALDRMDRTIVLPKPEAVSGSGSNGYVVQVAARKSQAGALAAFADLEQRYPTLLRGYGPMIQRAELPNAGTWFRLRIGPMKKRTEAASLCKSLRSAGLRSCLIRPR